MMVSLPSPGRIRTTQLALAFADRDGDVLELAGPDHPEPVRRADLERAQLAKELIQVPDGVPVDGHDRVALQQASLLGRPAGLDRDDQQPAFLRKLVRQGLAEPDGLSAQAQIGSSDPTVGPQAFGNALGGFDRDRAADAASEVPAIDADDAALGVDKRPA